jgi:hypothetical protein
MVRAFSGGFAAPDEEVFQAGIVGGKYVFAGQARLLEINPPGRAAPRDVSVLMTKAPVVSAGYGGWSRVARPRRGALTEWVGRDALSVTFDFVVDSFATGRGQDVEDTCQLLDEFAGVEQGDPEPPLFELHSTPEPLMPHGYHRAKQNKWFIETLTWDADLTRYNNSGNRIRGMGTLIVTVWNGGTKLTPASQKRGSAEKGGRTKSYTVKKTDRRFSQIAARKEIYGDGRKWKKIAEANGVRDVKIPARLRGKKIKIPV